MNCRRLNLKTSPTSMNFSEVACTPSTKLRITGIAAARAMNTTLATSSKPNQSEISGIQARSAICLSPLNQVVTIRSAIRDRPSTRPTITPTSAPSRKPSRSRRRLAESAWTSSPLASSRHAVGATCSSGGRNWRLTRPEWLKISHKASRNAGSTSPRPTVLIVETSEVIGPPTLQPGFDNRQNLVAGKPDQSDHHHRDQHGIEPEHLATPDQQITEALRGGQQFHADQRDPRMSQTVAQSGEDRRHRARQHYVTKHLQRCEAECLAHFHQRARHVGDPCAGVHDDGYKGRLDDHDDLQGLTDPEQQHGKRNPGERRDLRDRCE